MLDLKQTFTFTTNVTMRLYRLLVELTLLEEFPTLSSSATCLPYLPCREEAAPDCKFVYSFSSS